MKKLLIAIFILGVSTAFTIENGNSAADNGKLAGTVTFNNTETQAILPDTGSEIYVISQADSRSTKYNDILGAAEGFQISKSDYFLATNNVIDPGRIRKAQELFNSSAEATARYLSGFKQLPGIVRTTVNGSGNYALSLKPGRYYILFISGSVKGNNSAEAKGIFVSRMVDIKPAGETLQDVGFEMIDKSWIRVVLASQRPGC